jgi:hypothetical protein
VSQFNAYSEKQLKQIAKLKGLLKDKVEPEFEINLTLKDIGQVSIHLKGEGLYEFLEFICLHPSASDHYRSISALSMNFGFRGLSQTNHRKKVKRMEETTFLINLAPSLTLLYFCLHCISSSSWLFIICMILSLARASWTSWILRAACVP